MLWRSRRDPLERVAVAPWSWGVCDVAGWGIQLEADRVLAEARALGVRALEAGPAGYLRRSRGLRCPAGFLAAPIDRSALGLVDRYAAYLARLKAELLVVAATDGGQGDPPPPAGAQAWAGLFDAIGAMAAIAHRHGVSLAVHPRFGSRLGTAEQLERFLVGGEAELCLDLGDLALAGIDPVELVELAPRRIRHVQVKTVDERLAAAVREGRLGYWEGVMKGLFRPAGAGDPATGAAIEALRAAGYPGWLSIEVETVLAAEPPAGEGPCAAIATAVDYLRDALAA